MTRLRRIAVALALSAAVLPAPAVARAEKLRDLAEVAGARDNQLLGYGIVTGLNGTGDDEQSPMALQSVLSMLRRLGVQVTAQQVTAQDIWLRNVAAVVVTTNLGAFAKTGTKVDVTVSSIGNARSISWRRPGPDAAQGRRSEDLRRRAGERADGLAEGIDGLRHGIPPSPGRPTRAASRMAASSSGRWPPRL